MKNLLDSYDYLSDLDSVVLNSNFQKLDGASVLITGAYGMIASFLIDCLMYYNIYKGGHIKIFAISRSRDKSLQRFGMYSSHPLMNFLYMDVTQPLNININFDIIIHAASNAHPLAFATNPVDTMKANLLGTINLLEYAVHHNSKRFIFFSSTEVYGQNESSFNNPLIESAIGNVDINNVRASYPESKRAGEVLCMAYKEQYGINTVSIRPGYIYGPTMTMDSTKADVQFIRKAILGEDIVLKSEALNIRSYCYVSDCADAIFQILFNGKDNSYNIGGADIASIREFAEIAAKIAGVKIIFEVAGDVEKKGYSTFMNGIISNHRINAIGYNPRVCLNDGISRTIGILKTVT